jgi:predicted ArsR family transcriptional regulator
VALERTPDDLDMFMNNALAEALAEARAKTPDELKADAENALDDEEMMKEIEEVFEKANQELLASLEDIRTEQVHQLHCIIVVATGYTFSKILSCITHLSCLSGCLGQGECGTECTVSNGYRVGE